jgi:hypothetical protein
MIDVPMVDALWGDVKPIINDCCGRMKLLLNRLGVSEDEASPFLREFQSPSELGEVYKAYCSKSVDGDKEEIEADETEDLAVENTSNGRSCCPEHLAEFLEVAIGKSDGDDASDEECEADGVNYVAQDVVHSTSGDVGFDYSNCGDDTSIMSGWLSIIESSIEDLANNCKIAIGSLVSMKTGSISSDTKRKSLQGRWYDSKKSKGPGGDALLANKVIERNVHVQLEMIEKAGGGAPVKKSIEDYRVLGIKTKYNNKWFSCEVGKQIWNKDSSKGKYWGNGKIVIPRVV